MTSTDVNFFFSSSTGVSEIKKIHESPQTDYRWETKAIFVYLSVFLLAVFSEGGGAGKEEWLKIIFVYTTSSKEGRKQYTGEK